MGSAHGSAAARGSPTGGRSAARRRAAGSAARRRAAASAARRRAAGPGPSLGPGRAGGRPERAGPGQAVAQRRRRLHSLTHSRTFAPIRKIDQVRRRSRRAARNHAGPPRRNQIVLYDLSLAECRAYKPERDEPADFDAFWADTMSDARSHPIAATFEPYDAGLMTIDVSDVTFAGYGGQPIKGWFLAPARRRGLAPCPQRQAPVRSRVHRLRRRPRPADRLAPAAECRIRPSRDGHARPGQHVARRRHVRPGRRRGNRPLPGLCDPRHRRSRDLLLPPPHDRRRPSRRSRARPPARRPGAHRRRRRQPGRRPGPGSHRPRPGPAARR